jgi:hypothetical protein
MIYPKVQNPSLGHCPVQKCPKVSTASAPSCVVVWRAAVGTFGAPLTVRMNNPNVPGLGIVQKSKTRPLDSFGQGFGQDSFGQIINIYT